MQPVAPIITRKTGRSQQQARVYKLLKRMNFNRRSFKTLLLYTLLFTAQFAFGNIRLPKLVSDGMVLQRGVETKIWGWASPGEKIGVKFIGKSYAAVTAPDGTWKIRLAVLNATGPHSMYIRSGKQLIIISDILIGDIWFCSGQSNMVLPMQRLKEKYPEDIRTANYPEIRNFFIPTSSNVTKTQADFPAGKWVSCTPATVLDFGATSYFFARQLYNRYHVPIGIINSSIGGTLIQAWISADGIKDISKYTNRLAQLRDSSYLNHIRKATRERAAQLNEERKIIDKGLTGPVKWFDTSYITEAWHHYWLPGYWADQGIKGLNGIVWFRKEINITASMTNKTAKLYMGRIVDADKAYVNGVLVGETTYQYPPRRYTLPANLLKPGKNLVVVRVENYSGKGGFVPDKSYFVTDGSQTIDIRGDWQYKVGGVFKPVNDAAPDENFVEQNEPSSLYNTMVAPAINYSIKGIVWYQGESNSGSASEYAQLLPALIKNWRNKWNMGDIPFVYAQLPNFMEAQYTPGDSEWAVLREAQLKALSVANTAMAVTIDAGEWNDVHPLNKAIVGERLALAAEKAAYNERSIVSSGPVYQSSKVEDSKIIIMFNNCGSGLVARNGKELEQFAIAGADKKYVWAKAIIDGDKVIVWSDEIKQPLYVRYAWADNPDGANLYNKEGLPASPFTTDSDY